MELILRPEMLVVEHYLAPEFLGDWPERVQSDGIIPHFQPDERRAIEFAYQRKESGSPLDLALIDLDLPHPHANAYPVYLLGVLRGLFPKIPALFFSNQADFAHLIGYLPPPRTFIQRIEPLPDFLEALRPYLLKDPSEPNENAPPE